MEGFVFRWGGLWQRGRAATRQRDHVLRYPSGRHLHLVVLSLPRRIHIESPHQHRHALIAAGFYTEKQGPEKLPCAVALRAFLFPGSARYGGALRLRSTYTSNLRGSELIYSTITTTTTIICEQAPAYDLIPERGRLGRLLAEAVTWAAFALEHTDQLPPAVYQRAADIVRYNLGAGAGTLLVPSVLEGATSHQGALGLLREIMPAAGHPLGVTATGSTLTVSYAGMQLGMVATEDEPWLRPLLPFGARCVFLDIAAREEAPDRCLRLACAFTGISSAIHRLKTDGIHRGEGHTTR